MKKILFLLLCLFFSSFCFSQSSRTDSEEYFKLYLSKLEDTYKNLTYMNKKSALAKLGKETIEGTISGTLLYDAKVKGAGGVVLMKYTNFSNEEGWIFDGEIIVYSNMIQNGSFEGTITVTGNQSGSVIYDDVKMKGGMPSEGFYQVKKGDSSFEKVPYTVYVDFTKK